MPQQQAAQRPQQVLDGNRQGALGANVEVHKWEIYPNLRSNARLVVSGC
jgi:hypothetical protein